MNVALVTSAELRRFNHLCNIECIFGADSEGLEVQLGNLLRAQSATLATAESCTGGQVGQMLTSVPGSSAYYRGGVVAYDNSVKERLLGVSVELLAREGAVSAACAGAMAQGAAEALDAQIGLATTGIAGPDGGSAEKPVGLVYLALYDRSTGALVTQEKQLTGDRAMIRERTALAALEMAVRQLTGSKP